MAKDNDYKKLIHTRRWVELRRQILTAHPLCERCEAEGYITAAVEVHHKRPVEHGVTLEDKRQLMFDPSNLMALCHACHVAEHVAMGRSGKAAAIARSKSIVSQSITHLFGRSDGEPGGVFSKDPTPL